MEEKALSIGLVLISVTLVVAPVLLAFNASGWSVQKVIMPGEEQMEDIEDQMKGIFGGDKDFEDSFELVSVRAVGSEISMDIRFSSPFDRDMIIQDIGLILITESDQEQVSELKLEGDNVELKPGETEVLKLTGFLSEGSQEFFRKSQYEALPSDLIVSEERVVYEVSGVKIQIDAEELEG